MLKNLFCICVVAMLVPQMASAAVVRFDVALDSSTNGTGSPGMGSATAFLNDLTGQFDVTGTFSGLNGNATNLHLHGLTATPGTGNAGVLVGGFTFDSGVQSGTFSQSTVIADPADVAGVIAGRSYLNLHSSTNTGGEIRGYLLNPTAVPEPATCGLLCLFAAGAAMQRRRR
tara:strand:+ start:81941 stop:82456 length:516 start_codon:yes stop_codon:yes gene_type:complete